MTCTCSTITRLCDSCWAKHLEEKIYSSDEPSPRRKTFSVADQITRQHVENLESQLAASRERERILREGLEKYSDRIHWDERTSIYNDYWRPISNGYDIADKALKAAEEVKC